MLRLTIKNIADHGLRFALTAFSVVLGVAFLVSTFITTDSLRETFDQLAIDIVGAETDYIARVELEFSEGLTFNRPPTPEAALPVIERVPGVGEVEGRIAVPGTRPRQANNVAISSNGPPLLGLNYSGESALQQFHLPDGVQLEYQGDWRQPGYVGQVAIDQVIADRYAFEVGLVYTVVGPLGPADFRLMAVGTFGSETESRAVALITAFDEQTTQEFLGYFQAYDQIAFTIEDGFDPDVVAAEVQAAIDAESENILTSYFTEYLQNPDQIPPGIRAQIDEEGGDPRAALEEASKARVEVVSAAQVIDENQDEFGEVLNILSGVLLGFAFIAIVVSAFIISNTFSILIGQRIRELGLLRAIGATGAQVTLSVLLEAMIIGITATLIGIAAGYVMAIGLIQLLQLLEFTAARESYPLRPFTLGAAAVVGVGITMISAALPAWRTRRIPPIAALRNDDGYSAESTGLRLKYGGALLLVGAILSAVALVTEPDTNRLIVLLATSAFLVFIGTYLASPIVARPITRALSSVPAGVVYLVMGAVFVVASAGGLIAALLQVPGNPVFLLAIIPAALGAYCAYSLILAGRSTFDVVGRMASANAGRSPQRTAATAAALTVGLALVSTVAVVSDSVLSTFDQTIEQSISADYFAYVSTLDPTLGFSPDATAQVNRLAEGPNPVILSALPYRFALHGVQLGGETRDIFATNLAQLESHINADIQSGSTLTAGPRSILLHENPAGDLGLVVGDTVPLFFEGGRSDDFTVEAIYADSTVLGDFVVDIAAFDTYLPNVVNGFMTIVAADDVPPEVVEAAIVRSLFDYPEIVVQDQEAFQETQRSQLQSILAIVIVFLGLTFVMAVIGIANTLALSVFERTREVGLLRAVGATRRQIASLIRSESILISLFGGLLGMTIGVAFGLVIANALPETFVDLVTIPWLQLGAFLTATIVFGLLAAIFPARRAAKMNVLEAISHE